MTTEPRSFRDAYDGWLSGLLEWSDYDQVMALVAADPAGWWVYDTRGEVPSSPTEAVELADRLAEIDAFLRGRHRANYCGFVYVDDRVRPSLVKVYDPRNASACGVGGSIAAFTVSRMQPERLPFRTADEKPAPGLLERLFKGSK